MLRQQFEEQLAEKKANMGFEEDGESGRPARKGSLRFLTFLEYQDEVGNEAFWLHTLWDSFQLGPFSPDIMDRI